MLTGELSQVSEAGHPRLEAEGEASWSGAVARTEGDCTMRRLCPVLGLHGPRVRRSSEGPGTW